MVGLFDQFWAVYPRKVAKKKAEQAWNKRFNGLSDQDAQELFDTIMIAIDLQKRYRKRAQELGHFVPDWSHPATWINGDRWEDEIPSFSELEKEGHVSLCRECDEVAVCQNLCAYHWTKKNGGLLLDEVNDAYKRYGVKRRDDETREEWWARLQRLQKHFTQRIGV